MREGKKTLDLRRLSHKGGKLKSRQLQRLLRKKNKRA